MTNEPEGAQPPFKDYYLLLQLHPEADAGMIDAAYWHLARRYNKASVDDPSAKAKLDDLNEAYAVLGSAERREAYNNVRNAVLGAGTLPAPAPPKPEPAPLAVLDKRRPKPPAEATPPRPKRSRPSLRQISIPPWQNAANALILLTLASTAVLAWANPALVGALALAGVVLVTLPLVRKVPRLSIPKPRFRASAGRRLDQQGHAHTRLDSEALRRSTEKVRAHWRAATQEPATSAAPQSQPGHEPPQTATDEAPAA
ncbi:MAG: hypothetical protein A2148_02510 [Chloroflexi bacterium RBG_16_68_14]|nr:MAG: hypothetical protein A2148_02510 [Chloroflexi bacterium RBG_16_68_14]